MAGFDGSGTFVREHDWETDRLAGIKVRSDRMDEEDDNFAAGLSMCLTNDGQQKWTGTQEPNTDNAVDLGAVLKRLRAVYGAKGWFNELETDAIGVRSAGAQTLTFEHSLFRLTACSAEPVGATTGDLALVDGVNYDPAGYDSSNPYLAGKAADGNWRALLDNTGALTKVSTLAATDDAYVEWTGLPSGIKEIVVIVEAAVLATSSSVLLLQLGNSSAIETTGYTAGGTALGASASNASGNVASGIPMGITQGGAAGTAVRGRFTCISPETDKWDVLAQGYNGVATQLFGNGTKSTTGTTGRVRITTNSGNITSGNFTLLYR